MIMKEQLDKYFRQTHIATFVPIMAAVVAIIGFGIFFYYAYFDSARQFNPNISSYSMNNYIDVIMISDEYAYKGTDEYYFAIDADNNYTYILKLDYQTFKTLRAANEYSHSTAKDRPAPVRITGISKKISNKLSLISKSSYEDLSGVTISADADDIFGSYYLDCTHGNTYLIVSLLTAVTFGLMAVGTTISIIYAKRKNNQLYYDSSSYPYLQSDLADSVYHFDKYNILITEHYLISKAIHLNVYKLRDILWIYQKDQKYYGLQISKSIMLGLSNGKCVLLTTVMAMDDSCMYSLAKIISEKNPNLIIGNDKSAKAEFKRLTNQ